VCLFFGNLKLKSNFFATGSLSHTLLEPVVLGKRGVCVCKETVMEALNTLAAAADVHSRISVTVDHDIYRILHEILHDPVTRELYQWVRLLAAVHAAHHWSRRSVA